MKVSYLNFAKVLHYFQSKFVTFFWVELGTHNVLMPNSSRKFYSIMRGGEDIIHAVTSDVV